MRLKVGTIKGALIYLSANGAGCEKCQQILSTHSETRWKSLTPFCSNNPAEEKILCESRCSPVTIPHKYQINNVVIHERYQAAGNNVFRNQ